MPLVLCIILSCDYYERTNNDDPGSSLYKKSSIVISADSVGIENEGSCDFGIYSIGNAIPKNKNFRIENKGEGDLVLLGDLPVMLDGDTCFEITNQPDRIIPPGQDTEFSIGFFPESVGEFSSTVTLLCDDMEYGTFIFSVEGEGTPLPAPEIEVKDGTISIDDEKSSNPTYENVYSTIEANSTIEKTFTIYNNGDSDLDLSENQVNRVTVVGAAFRVSSQPNTSVIAESGSCDFKIIFEPSTEGDYSATVTINSNDDDEDPYIFIVSGTATAETLPNIEVYDNNSTLIEDNNAAVITDFGNVAVDETSSLTFHVKNTGTDTLNISSITVKGTDASMFSVSLPHTFSVSHETGNNDHAIVINFSPSEKMSALASIDIENDDPVAGKQIYTLYFKGTGIAPVIGISGYAIGSDCNLPDTFINRTYDKSFTVTNTGDDDLEISSIVFYATNGDDAAFQCNTAFPLTVPAGNTSSVAVQFTPTDIKSFECQMRVNSNDGASPVYTVNLSGAGIKYHGIGAIDTGFVGMHTSMAVQGDSIYICYYDYIQTNQAAYTDDVPGILKFARSGDGGSTWEISVIDQVPNVRVGQYASLTADGENIHISYLYRYYTEMADSNKLRIASSSDGGTSWSIQDITTVVNYLFDTSLHLSDGSLYLGYYYNNNTYFDKSSTGPGNLAPTVVGSGYMYLDLFYDAYNEQTIFAYKRNVGSKDPDYDLYVRVNDDTTGWSSEKCVDSTGLNTGSYISIATDEIPGPANSLFISYYDVIDKDLCFAKGPISNIVSYFPTTGYPVTLDSTGDVGQYSSIAYVETGNIVNPDKNLFISYYDASSGNLKLIKSANYGDDWGAPLSVDTTGDVGKYCSIAVDTTHIYISYFDETNGSLKFAKSIDLGGDNW